MWLHRLLSVLALASHSLPLPSVWVDIALLAVASVVWMSNALPDLMLVLLILQLLLLDELSMLFHSLFISKLIKLISLISFLFLHIGEISLEAIAVAIETKGFDLAIGILDRRILHL